PLTQESPRDGLCKSAGDSPEVHQPIRSTPSIDVNLSQLHTVRAKASFEVFGAKRQIDFSVAFVTPMSDQLGEEQLARRMFRFQTVHRRRAPIDLFVVAEAEVARKKAVVKPQR